jgi:UDP-glucose 4-epimerase
MNLCYEEKFMNIFITGGAGYIGSATAESLLKAGHSVTIYDSLVSGHREAVPAGAHFIHADLADAEKLQSALTTEKFEAVMHFAAFIEAGESMKEPGRFFENNFVNSLRLIETATRAGVKRFVLSSTAAVYKSSDEPLTEESPLGPTNVYGQTKWMVEQALEWYRQIHGLHFAALRYFNLSVPLGKLDSINVNGTDYLTPDGTCIRDYIHIADLVSAHLLCLDALGEHDQLVYNVGSGSGYSVREVIETARVVTGHPIPSVESPRREGDPARLVASSEKIRRELGWSPQHDDLRDILASAWGWHQSHPNGYEEQP